MKVPRTFGQFVVSCILCCFVSGSFAQTSPKLTISKIPPASVQVNWTNQVGISYHVQFTTNLTKPFSPLEDAFSADPLVTVYASTALNPIGFFRIQVPTNSSTANVQIFSPSNSLTVSGEISVNMGAQLGTQVQGVNLYLDSALVGYLNSGGMSFNLDTTHFINGQHTIYVGAVDSGNNETLSSSITLDFENSVRWLDADTLFNSFMPIDVTADFFPADWLVTVTDTNNTIVRTITGSTSDGNISTAWDGTDDNGQPLPVENFYQINVDVTSSGSSSMMMASSMASKLGATSVSSALNSHGVPEFTVQKPAPNPLTAYLATLQIYNNLTPIERFIYPPLPEQPANDPYATTTIKMSARDLFLALHKSSNQATARTAMASPNASGSGSGSTGAAVWWENSWSSAQTIIARVPISGAYGTSISTFCNQLSALIENAADTVGNNRGVFQTTVQLIQSSSDLSNLTNNIATANVRAFYFNGHGNTNSIGTTTATVSAKNLGTVLGNYYQPFKAGKLLTISTHKPFSFVFLDGCDMGLGDFPETFGIPKAATSQSYENYHKHKRNFMGWTGPVTFQFNNVHFSWTQKFWTTWLNDPSYDKSIKDAVDTANANNPSVLNNVPIIRYGSDTMTWSD